MSATQVSFYVTGGGLQRDAPCYVERHADADLYEALQRGEFCYVLTSRQMGKSSLMNRTAARLREEGAAVVVLDLTAIGQNVTPEQWYGGLIDRVGTTLDLEDELEAFWFEHERLGPVQRWMKALREVVLPKLGIGSRVLGVGTDPAAAASLPPIPNTQHPTPRLVIFIDEIDTVRSLPFATDEFFAAIRECYNRRVEDPELERLTFCLLGVAAPTDLIQDTRLTPFNIGRRIELTDFTEAEAAPLRAGLVLGSVEMSGRVEREARALLDRVLYWTGGHPYLTQRLCRAVAEDAAVRDPSDVDRECAALFFSSAAQEQDSNLLFVRERLLRAEAEVASLLGLYARVRSGKPVAVDDTNQLVSLLRLAGITRVDDERRTTNDHRRTFGAVVGRPSPVVRRRSSVVGSGARLVVRNRIYERVFDLTWVAQHMPDAEVRRQREAYRRGVARTASVAAVVVAVVLGLALMATSQARRAEEREETARRYLYAAQMRVAQQSWEEGNLRQARKLLDSVRPTPGKEDLRGFEWRYLWRLCQGDALATLRGHDRSVFAVAFSPDGRLMASSGADRTVRLWNVATRQEIATLWGHRHAVTAVTFSPDGRLLASVGSGEPVRLWEVRSRRLLATLGKASGWRRCLAFSPDGRVLAWSDTGSETEPGTIQLWDVSAPQALAGSRPPRSITTLPGRPGWVWQVAFSPDGKILAAGGYDGTVRLWSVAPRGKWSRNPRPIATYREHPSGINGLAFSPDGKLLATGSVDNTVGLWETSSRRLVTRLVGHLGQVDGIAFSPNGKILASSSFDQTIRLWDLSTRLPVATLRGHEAQVFGIAFSPDGRQLASGSADGTLKLWGGPAGWDRTPLIWQKSWVQPFKFSPDSQVLAVGYGDGTVKLWEVASRRHLATLAGHRGGVDILAYHPNGKLLLCAADGDSAKLWDVDLAARGRTPRRVASFPGFRGLGGGLDFSPDGRWMAMYTQRNVELRETTTWRLAALFPFRGIHAFGLLFSPDSRYLAMQGDEDRVTLWDVLTKRPAISVPGDANSPILFTPDGRTLLTGAGFRNVRLWDLATQRPIATIERQMTAGEGISLSPDARTLATIGGDSSVQLWSLAAQQGVATLRGHAGPLFGPLFSPDGRWLATGSMNGSVRLWPAASFAEADAPHVSASVADRRVLLQWAAVPGATGYYVYRRPADGTRAQLVRLTTEPVSEASFDDRSPTLANGRAQTYAVSALFPRGGGGTEEGPKTILRATPLALPPGFLGSSIHEASVQGSATFHANTGEVTVRGSGEDIGAEADACYLLAQPLVGDFQITVGSHKPRNLTQEWANVGAHGWENAGLMVRESLDPGARHVSLLHTPVHGLVYKRRPNHGVSTEVTPVPETFSFKVLTLRLTRRGDIITAEYSPDGGRSFRQVGYPYPADPPLPATLYAGLAVTSRDASRTYEARFSGLEIRKR